MDEHQTVQTEIVVSGPLSERLVHKVWKVRLAAYEELTKLFREALDDTDKVFYEYGKRFSSHKIGLFFAHSLQYVCKNNTKQRI